MATNLLREAGASKSVSRTKESHESGDFRYGSISTELGCRHHVRSYPVSDRTADIADGPVGATTGLMHCNNSVLFDDFISG
jgi:hypothetical protein